MTTKTKTKSPKSNQRMHQGEPVIGVPTPWWCLYGLKEGRGWIQMYQARSKAEANYFLKLVIDSDDPQYDEWDDFSVIEPELEHSIPSYLRGQHLEFVKSVSPVTAADRRAAMERSLPAGTRGRARKAKQ